MPKSAWGIVAMSVLSLCYFCGCRSIKPVITSEISKYIRIVKEGDRYWFSQGDQDFLALGVNCLLTADDHDGTDRPRYNALAQHDGNMESWAAEITNRLHTWHFNTISGWSDEYLYNNIPFFHTRVVWFGNWGSGRDMRLIDVWTDEYADDIDQTAQKHVAPYAENEYLIGYFINNELPWYGLRGWPTSPTVSLLSRYMQLAPLAPGKIKLITFLEDYYKGDFSAFSADWQVHAHSFGELPNVRRIQPTAPAAKRLVFAWTGIVAEQYYKVCTEAIRRYDPHHLILGSRMAGTAPRPVLEACGKYCDVISMNHYRKTGEFGDRQLGAIAALTGKPIMITEFSWRAMENNTGCLNSKGADVTVETQADRATCFRRYATAALEQPFIVGYDWFQYFDQPPHGRFDGEDSNYGLVDIDNNIYEEITTAITEINSQATAIHASSTIPMPAYDPDVLIDYREIKVSGTDSILESPIVWANGMSPVLVYGDSEHGAQIKVGHPAEQRELQVQTGTTGWGCGITMSSPQSDHPDGSMDLTGAHELILRIQASAPFKFSPGLNESGHGPVDAQTFDGFGNADGEAYSHMFIAGEEGLHDYVISLLDFEENPHHGNQRGNKTVDTDAIAELILYFPGSQGSFDLMLDSVTVK